VNQGSGAEHLPRSTIDASPMRRTVKRIVAVTIGSLFMTLVFRPAAHAQSATKVVTFRPVMPEGHPIEGSCWTGSIATDRPGAWRCTAKNMIYDPCFTVPGVPSIVVCKDDPFAKQAVALKLINPLPPEQKTRCKDCVWALELADGSTCTVAGTGTLAMVAGQPLRWDCANPSCSGSACPVVGIVGKLKAGRVWTAHKVWARWSGGSFRLLKSDFVAVRTVWR
jgi:hypothetical protein